MKIKVKLKAGNLEMEDTIDVDDRKLEELDEEDLEAAVEIIVSEWANRNVRIEWETEESEPDE